MLKLGVDEESSVASTDTCFRRDATGETEVRTSPTQTHSSQTNEVRQSRHQFVIHQSSNEKVRVDNHTVHGLFFLDHKGEVKKDVPLPTIKRTVSELKDMLPYHLDIKFEVNIICTDYIPVYQNKWISFMSRVQEMKTMLDEVDTPIVGFTGTFVQVLTTPLNYRNWTVQAFKLDGIIYVRSGKCLRRFNSDKSNLALMNFNRLLKLSYGEEDRVLLEKEKFFKFSSLQVNRHYLMTMNELNAAEDDGDDEFQDIKISLKSDLTNGSNFKKRFQECKIFEIWARALLSGQKKVIFGICSQDFLLTDIVELHTTADVLMAELKADLDGGKGDYQTQGWDPDAVLNFFDRFLSFIKNVMTDRRATEGRVVSFFYKKKDDDGKAFERIIPRFENYDYRRFN